MSHRMLHHNRHGMSYYDPRFQNPHFLRAIAFLPLGMGLAVFGIALYGEARARQRASKCGGLIGLALTLISTGFSLALTGWYEMSRYKAMDHHSGREMHHA